MYDIINKVLLSTKNIQNLENNTCIKNIKNDETNMQNSKLNTEYEELICI